MSHLKEYKTKIKNLEYLKKALNRMKVNYNISGQNIILPQAQEKHAAFCWNGEIYTLVYDLDFWTNPLTINSFIEKVTCEYSTEKVIQGLKPFGFSVDLYTDSYDMNSYHTVKTKDLILSRYVA